MPVDGHPAGVTHEWQDQEMRQGKLFWVAVLGKANHHIRVSHGSLSLVGAQSTSLLRGEQSHPDG